ncbi:hypothetical protein J6590_038191 [Homalodisca vitripennis]|nr:hypothetical protein J6590_038191 [Homalodisca vitripennis]
MLMFRQGRVIRVTAACPTSNWADVVLLWKIVNGRMNCPDLLAEIDLRVPANTRSRDLLDRRYHSTNFDFNSPFARFIRLGNQVASGCDLFFDGLHQVRRQAFSLLSVRD